MCSVPPIDAIAVTIGFFFDLLINFLIVLNSFYLALTTIKVGSSIAQATPTRSSIFMSDYPLAIVYKWDSVRAIIVQPSFGLVKV